MNAQFEDDDRSHPPSRVNKPFSIPEQPRGSWPWGVIGQTRATQTDHGECEILRQQVGADVVYHKPPLSESAWQWLPSRSGGEPYTLSLDGEFPWQFAGEEPSTLRSLEVFRAESSAAWSADSQDPRKGPALIELDEVVQACLELTCHLHRNGWGLGLATPSGLLLEREGPSVTVFPCDLGFVYERSSDFGVLPPWLDDTGPVGLKWGKLFGQQPLLKVHQLGCAERADLNKLVHLIDWLLTGEVRSQIPASADVDPSTHAAVWGVLREVELGNITTAEALRDLLNAYPPSKHFLPRSGREGPGARPGGKAGAGLRLANRTLVYLTAVAGIASLAWWYEQRQPPVSSPPAVAIDEFVPGRPDRELPPASRLAERVAAYEATSEGKVGERLDALLVVYATPRSDSPDLARLENQYLGFVRNNFLEWLDQQMQRQIKEDGSVLHAVSEIRHIEKALVELADFPAHPSIASKEKACLEYCQHWLAEQPRVD